MKKFIFLPLVTITFMALAGCAPVPMKIDEWETSVSRQELRLRGSDICCESFDDLEFVPLTDGENQLQLDVDNQVMIMEGRNRPVIGLEISRASRSEHLEFFSYSERKRVFLRINRVLFLRPNIAWLDDEYTMRYLVSLSQNFAMDISAASVAYGGSLKFQNLLDL